MIADLTNHAAHVRNLASEIGPLTEGDKVLVGCLLLTDSLRDVRRALAPDSAEINVSTAILRASKSIALEISGAAARVCDELGP